MTISVLSFRSGIYQCIELYISAFSSSQILVKSYLMILGLLRAWSKMRLISKN